MKKLPLGYYAVKADGEELNGSFIYKGVEYSAEEGVNLFACLNDAMSAASEVPTEIISGLDYESFTTPVIIMGKGRHNYNKGAPGNRFVPVTHSITILGEGACVSPSLPSSAPEETPPLNPERSEDKESELYGSFWWGRFIVSNPGIDTIIFDGFTFSRMCLEDTRSDEELNAYVSYRNIIYKSPVVRRLFRLNRPKKDGKLYRHLYFQNLRLVDIDDLDYGNYFCIPAEKEVVFDGIVVDKTTLIFGFTTLWRDASNMPPNCDSAKFDIKNSYFKALLSENSVSVACADIGERKFDVSIENTVFCDSSATGEPAFNIDLPGNNVTLSVRASTFLDTRKNSATAISVRGEGCNVKIEDTSIIGFSGDVSHSALIEREAPAYIENHEEDWESSCEDPHVIIGSKSTDFSPLDELYEGRHAYYGDLHVHTDCGGTSDGHVTMAEWPSAMDAIDLDFAVVVDHGQMRGYFLPEWDEEKFVIGTEPSTFITNLNAPRFSSSEMHYNMIFPHKYGLAMVMANFPEYKFSGTELNGKYIYANFTKERFSELVKFVYSIGGIVVHAHPKILMSSHDPLDYYIGERTYVETLYEEYGSNTSHRNYNLWCQLLALGKHVLVSSGSDTHARIKNNPVATFYTKEKNGRAFFEQMRSGDYTVGPIGIKMTLGKNPIGSELEYKDGEILLIKLGDFYRHAFRNNNVYELRVISDKGIVYSSRFDGKEAQSLAIRVKKRAFYRAEVVDITRGYRLAMTNPIWLDK